MPAPSRAWGDNIIVSAECQLLGGLRLWVYPYFDDCIADIEILPGSVYKAIDGASNEAETKALIVDCQQDKV